MWAHWRHLANMIELVLPSTTRVHNPNGKSIGSAISAQLTAESPFIKLPLLLGDLDAIQFMTPWAILSPQPKRHLDRLTVFCTDDLSVPMRLQ